MSCEKANISWYQVWKPTHREKRRGKKNKRINSYQAWKPRERGPKQQHINSIDQAWKPVERRQNNTSIGIKLGNQQREDKTTHQLVSGLETNREKTKTTHQLVS